MEQLRVQQNQRHIREQELLRASFRRLRDDIHRLAEIIDRVTEQEFRGDYTPVLPKLLKRERSVPELRRLLGLEDE